MLAPEICPGPGLMAVVLVLLVALYQPQWTATRPAANRPVTSGGHVLCYLYSCISFPEVLLLVVYTPLGLTCTLRSTEKVLVRSQLLEQLSCSAFEKAVLTQEDLPAANCLPHRAAASQTGCGSADIEGPAGDPAEGPATESELPTPPVKLCLLALSAAVVIHTWSCSSMSAHRCLLG